MTIQKILNRLEREEVNGKNGPDMRNILRQERFGLLAVLRDSRDRAVIAARMDEALRVARMWGVEI